MFSTLYLILLIAFQFWYFTSRKVKYVHPAAYLLHIIQNRQRYRIIGGVLLVFVAALYIMRLGWMSGLSAWLVGLMGIGGLVTMLAPFKYLRWETILTLYIFFFILELAI